MEGEICVCDWLGAPSMHRMSGLSLVGHWHGCGGHVHLRSQFETVEYGGWLFRLPAFVIV